MLRRWTHNRLLFTKLWLLKNLKKVLMDYIQSLLIAEDDLDDLNEEGNVLVMNESEETEQSLISASSRFIFLFFISPSSRLLTFWCKSRVCEIMPQEIENKYCLQHECMTTHFSVGLQNPYLSGQTMEGRDLSIIACGRTFPYTNHAHHIRCPASQSTCSVANNVKTTLKQYTFLIEQRTLLFLQGGMFVALLKNLAFG